MSDEILCSHVRLLQDSLDFLIGDVLVNPSSVVDANLGPVLEMRVVRRSDPLRDDGMQQRVMAFRTPVDAAHALSSRTIIETVLPQETLGAESELQREVLSVASVDGPSSAFFGVVPLTLTDVASPFDVSELCLPVSLVVLFQSSTHLVGESMEQRMMAHLASVEVAEPVVGAEV